MRILKCLAALAMLAPSIFVAPTRYGDQGKPRQIAVIEQLVESGQHDKAQLLLANSYFNKGDLGYVAALL